MDNLLDLDALVPPAAIVKFEGNEIEVKPPKTGDVLKLGNLATKLQNIDKLDETEILQLVDSLTEVVRRCIPELNDKELNTQQLLKLVEMIGNMATPPDVKELNQRGVSVGDPKAQSES